MKDDDGKEIKDEEPLLLKEGQGSINKDDESKKEIKDAESLFLKEGQGSINKDDESEKEVKEKKSCCQFPSAFTIILIIHTIIFLLLYIIPKGKYGTIEYSNGIFIIKSHNQSDVQVNATEEYLKERGIKVPLSSFEQGFIKKPISIPNTYKRIEGETTNFGNILLYPILGLIDSADISFFLMLLGGCLNILTEMKALSSGVKALSRLTKGKEFILLCLIYVLISIGTNLYGMSSEILAFYPILMPIYLKNGMDGILGFASLYIGMFTGNMFSTVNPFSVVVASYSSGISFLDGVYFRIICLLIINIVTILYFYYYYRKVRDDENNSIVLPIKQNLEDKYLKDVDKEDNNPINEELEDKFTLKQKIVLFIFLISIAGLVIGVIIFNWWFDQMGAIFLLVWIILMFFLGKKERESVKIFMRGVTDYADFAVISGISRGINISLEKGQIADTILYHLSNITAGLPKIAFAILLVIIFIFLGFLVSGWTSLALLSMPVIAPLADKVNCSRSLVVNAYMFGQSYIELISPTSFILVALEFAGIQYNYWLKFIYSYMIILLIMLIIFIIINTLL